ncbi:sorbosone dehydrogenase family protein [Mucilaginibacter sp. Bleaf8]|uniref:PQQ-dependent sugar dehydrogenase n=1 Tax=Mucilaginibacter sp. Bleaf8 TaxID=2834430 RepID=UPI001BCDF2DA|nr:sorbosone dehydrogenase family protein [Mucilaginibacter sp. Bleaf8]MBS7564211.1 sorbosone dehydrogenase family protein [Mucilaginibacter sp. Bleaf8]
MKTTCLYTIAASLLIIAGCSQKKKPDPKQADSLAVASGEELKLPPPFQTKSVQVFAEVTGWPKDTMPTAPKGFKVNMFANNLNNPRNLYVGPNGDVFAAQATTEASGTAAVKNKISGKSQSQNMGKSPNNIIILRDVNGDGTPDQKGVFLSNLKQPYGMAIVGKYFYVANTDGLWRYPYTVGDSRITKPGERIVKLPAGGYNNHWTRNLAVSPDSTKLFIAVGSGSNVGEHGMANEARRAAVLVVALDGSNEKIYADGLRNPAGIDFQPGTNVLWAAVNERDELGDELVPDYLTSVKEGGFYGWPYAYFGQHEDPRRKGERPDLVKKSIVPDVPLGSHTASLGLAFYDGTAFPEKYKNGAFIGQHGSWNSSKLVGYKVMFVPFTNNKPGKPEDFLTGFIADPATNQVHGRPVGVAVAKDGSLLVADDAGNTIWRVSAAK